MLRQIETLQNQYAVASENWQGIEGSLLARVTVLERERDEIAKREGDVRRKAREMVIAFFSSLFKPQYTTQVLLSHRRLTQHSKTFRASNPADWKKNSKGQFRKEKRRATSSYRRNPCSQLFMTSSPNQKPTSTLRDETSKPSGKPPRPAISTTRKEAAKL